jgi:hypothetical protein
MPGYQRWNRRHCSAFDLRQRHGGWQKPVYDADLKADSDTAKAVDVFRLINRIDDQPMLPLEEAIGSTEPLLPLVRTQASLLALVPTCLSSGISRKPSAERPPMRRRGRGDLVD